MAEINLNTRYVLKSDTKVNWESINPSLLPNEIVFDTTENDFKINSGSTLSAPFSNLSYLIGSKLANYLKFENNINGIVKANGGVAQVATKGTDYPDPAVYQENSLIPTTNRSFVIGNYNYQLSNIYTNTLQTSNIEANSAAIRVNGGIYPGSPDGTNLGTGGDRWKGLFLSANDNTASNFAGLNFGLSESGSESFLSISYFPDDSTLRIRSTSNSQTSAGKILFSLNNNYEDPIYMRSYTLDTTGLYPETTHTCNLGSSSKSWYLLYADLVYTSGIYGLGSSNINVNNSIVPFRTGVNLGSSTIPFGTLYIETINLLGSMGVQGNITPNSNNTQYLGSANNIWNTIYTQRVQNTAYVSLRSDSYIEFNTLAGASADSLRFDVNNKQIVPMTDREWNLGSDDYAFNCIYLLSLKPYGNTTGGGNIGDHYIPFSRVHSCAYFLENRTGGGSADINGRLIDSTSSSGNSVIHLLSYQARSSSSARDNTLTIGNSNINISYLIGNYTYIYGYQRVRFQAFNTNDSSQYKTLDFAYSGRSTLATYGDGDIELGWSNHKWNTVYAVNGTIQSSDRSAKSDIHYIDSPKISTMSINSINNIEEDNDFTTSDLINFIRKLNPAVFRYGKQGTTINEALEGNRTEDVQLGLIADDIKDERLFNYIGATMHYEDEETKEDKVTLGVKAVPLAVLALSACKYLINKVEELENK